MSAWQKVGKTLGSFLGSRFAAKQIGLLNREVRRLESEKELLRRNLARKEAEAAELWALVQVRAKWEDDGLAEAGGALFKRRPSKEGYYDQVFCPRCKIPIPAPGGYHEYQCHCGWRSLFTQDRLHEVMAMLPPHAPLVREPHSSVDGNEIASHNG